MNSEFQPTIAAAVERFIQWLDTYGETSQDHQDFYNNRFGRAAKRLYYDSPAIGTAAVLPIVLCEAFAPWTRRFFHPRSRLPIADAHYAMGFALLHQATGNEAHYHRALHFLQVLEETRCPGYDLPTWGYPFDWQTREGLVPAGTPLITTVPYCYEAFDAVYQRDGNPRWREVMHGIAEHALRDYDDVSMAIGGASCTYFPHREPGVVNASAYRAFLLTHAYSVFADPRYRQAAERNLEFVLHAQRPDGSWPYAVDGVRDFVDHFHTCFVLKALAKIVQLGSDNLCQSNLDRGVHFYLNNLFDQQRLPKPFAAAPRLTVYTRELYDCAECLNLSMILGPRFPQLASLAPNLVVELLRHWITLRGAFRSRKLVIGYDNVPMHRWGQSQTFRALSLLLTSASETLSPTAINHVWDLRTP